MGQPTGNAWKDRWRQASRPLRLPPASEVLRHQIEAASPRGHSHLRSRNEPSWGKQTWDIDGRPVRPECKETRGRPAAGRAYASAITRRAGRPDAPAGSGAHSVEP